MGGGLFTKVHFNGYEDTTELDDAPIKGAEHWYTSSVLPQVLSVTYDYFVHREGDDVISHLIDFNTSVSKLVPFCMEDSQLRMIWMRTGRSLLSQTCARATFWTAVTPVMR